MLKFFRVGPRRAEQPERIFKSAVTRQSRSDLSSGHKVITIIINMELGNFGILSIKGQGGFGRVYKAFAKENVDDKLVKGEIVAIKSMIKTHGARAMKREIEVRRFFLIS